MGEWNYMLLMPISSLLFMLGGYKWKWIRRYILPVFLGTIALINGVIWWKVASLVLGTGLVFHLPYGDSIDWTLRVMIGCLYGIMLTPLGLTIWQPILVVTWILMFVLSRLKSTQGVVAWKIWEGTIGFLIGLNVAYLLCRI